MSFDKFDDNCTGCRPCIFDPRTGNLYPATHPAVIAATKAWTEFPIELRRGFHRFTCLNERDPEAMEAVRQLSDAIKAAAGSIEI